MERSTVEKSLDASIKDGTAYAVMVGLGEAYVPACAHALGASKSAVALLATLPLFLGSCAQLLTPRVIDRTGRRKPIVLVGGALHALTWLPMILSLFVPPPWGFRLLLGSFVLYFAFWQFTLPAWMSLMGDLVPADVRGRYFGRRSAVALLMQGLATAVGGIGLSVYHNAGHEALGFGVVFAGALVARSVSVYYLSRMAEPAYVPKEEDRFTLWQFLRRLPKSNFAKFVFFVACLNGSAHFVGSLFVPYFLQVLKFGYWEYTAAMTSIMLIQIPALVFWGRVADRYGNKKVLMATALGISVLPALWLVSTSLVWACLLQMIAGLSWSGFNQSVSNFLFDAVTPSKRVRCTAYMNLIANVGLLLGGIAGALMIRIVPQEIGPVRMPYAIWWLFLLSFLLRLATLIFFLPRFREVRDVPKIGVAEMLFHATREATGSAANLVTGWTRKDEDVPPKES